MTKREGLSAMAHEEDDPELAAETIDTPAESVTEALEVAVAEATEVEVLVGAAVGRVPPTDIVVTVSSLPLPEFRYHSMLKASATFLTIHPLAIALGYSVSKTSTVLLSNSCSKSRRPCVRLPVTKVSK